MRRRLRRCAGVLCLWALVLALWHPGGAWAGDAPGLVCDLGFTTIQVQPTPHGDALFLPAFADAENLHLPLAETADGQVTISVNGEEIRVYQSANLASLFLTSEPAGLWMADEQGRTLCREPLAALFAQASPGKPSYQIAFSAPVDLTGGEPSDRWLLLGEQDDATRLRSLLTLNLARGLQMDGAPDWRPVDLYLDGRYCGHYLLCQDPGLNVRQLWGHDAAAFQEEETDVGLLRYPASRPDTSHAEAGWLLEWVPDASAEECLFTIASGDAFRVHSPACPDPREMAQVQRMMNDLVLMADNGGVHPVDGRSIETLLDLETTARWFLLQQFVRNPAFGQAYIQLPAGESRFRVGLTLTAAEAYPNKVEGYVGQGTPLFDWMRVPLVQQVAKRVFSKELDPLINGVVLAVGEQEQEGVWSLDHLQAMTLASRRMDAALWASDAQPSEGTLEFFLMDRRYWFVRQLPFWSDDGIECVALHMDWDDLSFCLVDPFTRLVLEEVQWQELPDPADPPGSMYTAQLRLTALPGSQIEQTAYVLLDGMDQIILRLHPQEMIVRITVTKPEAVGM